MAPAISQLIDALAERLVADYLASQAAPDNDDAQQRANPVPLRPVDRAA